MPPAFILNRKAKTSVLARPRTAYGYTVTCWASQRFGLSELLKHPQRRHKCMLLPDSCSTYCFVFLLPTLYACRDNTGLHLSRASHE